MGSAGVAVLAGVLAKGASAQEGTPKRRVLGISCSPRKGKTTAAALDVCLQAAREQTPGIETELVELAELSIPAQVAAGQPLRDGETDDFPMIAEKIGDPAVVAIIVGSPVYFSSMSALCKAFLDRCIACRKDGFTLRNKVAGVVAVGGTRNGGQEVTVQSIQAALMGQDVILVGTGKPSGRFGATLWNQDDSIEHDDFGKDLAASLGRRAAEVAAMVAE